MLRTIIECTVVYGGTLALLWWAAVTPYEEPPGWKELKRLGLLHLHRW